MRPSATFRHSPLLAVFVLTLGAALPAAGCADHLGNAHVRSAEDFECKRAKVRVTQVQDGIFVARGCGQEGAYRCEMGIEGGCRRLRGAPADKLIEMAPEGEGEDEDEAPKKKKKKKPAADDDATTTEPSSGKDAETKGDSEKSGSEKKTGSEKSGSEKSSSEKKGSSDKSGSGDPPPEKKKKKKQSGE